MADMSNEDCRASTTSSGNIDETGNTSGRRMSHFKEYKFFRSFSAKVENWPMRKAEALWRRMRERKIAGKRFMSESVFHKIYITLRSREDEKTSLEYKLCERN